MSVTPDQISGILGASGVVITAVGALVVAVTGWKSRGASNRATQDAEGASADTTEGVRIRTDVLLDVVAQAELGRRRLHQAIITCSIQDCPTRARLLKEESTTP